MSVTNVDEFRRKFCHPRKGETPSMFVFTLAFIQNDVFIKLYLFISRIKQQCTLICEVKTRRKHQKRLKFKSTWKKSFRCGGEKIWKWEKFEISNFLFSISGCSDWLSSWRLCRSVAGKWKSHFSLWNRLPQESISITDPNGGDGFRKPFQFAQLNWLQFVRSNLGSGGEGQPAAS